MTRVLIILAALSPAMVEAQGVARSLAPSIDAVRPAIDSGSHCKTLICGMDALAVSHVWFDGGGIRDTKGFPWSMTGAVPQVARSGAIPAGAGPFSDTAYYSKTSPNALNFATGDFTVIVVAWMPNPAVGGVVISNTNYPATGTGWWSQINNRKTTFYTGATQVVQSVEQAPLNAVSVFCGGRAGANDVAQVNLGSFTSTAKTYTANTSDPVYIGRSIYPGNAYGSTVYEVVAMTVTPTAELCTTVAQQVKSKVNPGW